MRILAEDPELYETVAPDQRAQALEHCLAPAITVPPGAWEPAEVALGDDAIGLLVLDGLLLRRVGIDGRFGAELLGSGDLLRPWDRREAEETLPSETRWLVTAEMRIALLTAGVAGRLARYPALTGALAAKALTRSRRLSMMMAIVHHPRVEVRLHMLLWHLADRWGRVRSDGVLLPLRLSHSVLADLIVAQRPSVTGGLRRLSERNLVTRGADGWVLLGDPPGELLELQAMASV